MITNIFSEYQFPPLNLLIQLKNVDGYFKKFLVCIFLQLTNFFWFFLSFSKHLFHKIYVIVFTMYNWIQLYNFLVPKVISKVTVLKIKLQISQLINAHLSVSATDDFARCKIQQLPMFFFIFFFLFSFFCQSCPVLWISKSVFLILKISQYG